MLLKELVDIITFIQFEVRNLLSEYPKGTESGDESDDDSTIPPLIIEAKIDEISSVNESDAEPMPTYMLEDINEGIQYYPSVNRREVIYKICDCIKQRRA